MAPKVRLSPDFKIGETIECKSTGGLFKIALITPEGSLQCEGRAGLMPADAAQRPLTAEQKEELASDPGNPSSI